MLNSLGLGKPRDADQDKSLLVVGNSTGAGNVALVDKDDFESMLKAKSMHLKKCKYYLASAKDSELSGTTRSKNKKIGFGCLSPQTVADSYVPVFASAEEVEAIKTAIRVAGEDPLFIGYNSKGPKPTLLLTAIAMLKYGQPMFNALADVVASPACTPVKLTDFTYLSFSEVEAVHKVGKVEDASAEKYSGLFANVDTGVQLEVKEGPQLQGDAGPLAHRFNRKLGWPLL